jgi:hypothetical protein
MLTVTGGAPVVPPEAYLEKPLDPARLVQTIRGLLHEAPPPESS